MIVRRTFSTLVTSALVVSAQARTKQPDERFFDAFLPMMIGAGVLIVFFVVVVNVVAARRRQVGFASRAFDPTFDGRAGPTIPPRTVSKTTTTTSADGNVTVTVIEETTGGSSYGSVNGVVDPELFDSNLSNGLEEQILNEVKDAFRRIDAVRKPR